MSSTKEKQSPSLPQAGDSTSIRYQAEDDNIPTGTLHRRLNNRQIQLIAAGGSIGTALFISIGGGLAKGGAALVNNSIAEMSTYMPVAGGFIRLAGNWVDDALGFMAGWNFFLYEALLIPFEITALTSVIAFWDPNTLNPGPTAGVCAAVITAYALINILAVGFYGEFEFWLSGGKILLIFILFAFTFVTMCGGNPAHNAYGFRHFASGTFSTYLSTGPKGHFEGFLAALFSAGFTIVGPEYISMVSAEAQRPSIYIKNAFKTVYYRFCIFFVFGALAVGISCAHDDPKLTEIYFGSGSTGNAASSPFLQCANGSAEVLNWLVSIVTGGALINFLVISITFINYYEACEAQGVDRKTRPYYGYFQPYSAYIALAVQTLIVLTYGYYAFRPTWSTEAFFQNYSMQILAVILFVGWKLVKNTRYVRPIEVDLVWERLEIDAYENSLTEAPTGFWEEMGHLIGIRRGKKTAQA
ncbi:amino acid polyamine transporter [Fusarium sp. NRRL 25303]|nr:amino acid polyamine transporter [Fusarium sp. NRRL 25303]